MALNIFPTSPLPAGLTRAPFWNTSVVKYDSGARQATTPFVRPLLKYQIPFKNINELKQSAVYSFWNLQRGMTFPFLMADPIDFRVNSVFVVSGDAVSEPASLGIFDVTSFFILVDTTTIGSMTSNKSGFVTLGSEYDYDQDTGNLTVKSIDNDDSWTASSLQYFKKVAFESQYRETGIISGQFSVNVVIEELV
jgi:hypothetical protein